MLCKYILDYFHIISYYTVAKSIIFNYLELSIIIVIRSLRYRIQMSTECLFCLQYSTEACCSHCRSINRTNMFEMLLTQLGHASTQFDYYDRIKAMCQRIETVRFYLDVSVLKLYPRI